MTVFFFHFFFSLKNGGGDWAFWGGEIFLNFFFSNFF